MTEIRTEHLQNTSLQSYDEINCSVSIELEDVSE
jgi:hypothetical protein